MFNKGAGCFTVHLSIFHKIIWYTPSMLDSEVRKAAPVALAILFRSAFLHLLTAMAPASTKYCKQQIIQQFTGKCN
jgi:hypothetical protein